MTQPVPKRVLVVEDDASLSAALTYNFRRAGYDVFAATDGGRALELARAHAPNLVVLDLMLPGMSGLDVCRALRQEADPVPILMLTARDAEVDRVVGLEVGADDYVTKPFSMRELLARVSAMLRRQDMVVTSTASRGKSMDVGEFRIDFDARTLRRDGEEIRLRPKEFDLLAFLAQNRGRAFSRDQLLQQVWGYDFPGGDRTVDVHVRWLRQKIEREPSDPKLIVTVRGVGYRFD
jgi:two-component system OmpR family response regulator